MIATMSYTGNCYSSLRRVSAYKTVSDKKCLVAYPDFSIHLISTLKVLADVVLLLGNGIQFFATMDVNSADGLSQHGRAMKIFRCEQAATYSFGLSSFPNSCPIFLILFL